MKKALFSLAAIFIVAITFAQTQPPTASPQTICIGTSATLTAASPQVGVTFSWWDAPTAGNQLSTGATFVTAPLSVGTVFYVQAELNGIASARTSVQTTVANVPTVGASMDTIYACSGDVVAMSATIKHNVGQITWYDAASGGNLLASGMTYTLPSIPLGATSFFAQTSIGNCVNPIRAEVVVINVDGVITPTVNTTSFSVCYNQSVTLTGSSNVPGFEVQWWTDSVGGTLIGIGSSVTFNPQTSMVVYADIELNSIACDDEGRVPVDITVYQQLLSPNNRICADLSPNSVTFTWDPVAGATGYEVSLDGGATWIAANTPPTSHIVSGLAQNTQQMLRVRALDGTNGCPPGKESGDKTCATIDCGPLNISVPPTYDVCSGGHVTVVLSGYFPSIHRVIVNGQVMNKSSFTFTPSSDSTISFTIFNYLYPECDSTTVSTTVNVYDLPSASPTATAQDSAYPGSSVDTYLFEANSSGNVVSWTWDFGDGSGASTENAMHTYSNAGFYNVTLTVTTSDGCTATFSLNAVVEVFEVPEIFMPNSFTPNGDNNNDVLYVYGEYVELQEFIIFNQYGDEVFRTSDISEGWDGTWKGVQQPGGVYIFQASLTDALENVYQEQGTVTLIR